MYSRKLPRHYGVGLDERVVEYPWLWAQKPRGRVLDAGSTLNHAHILDRFLSSVESLDIVTLVPEEVSFPERGVSYVYADLRDLPFRDDYYDTIVSISTLEHVGMDNAQYGGAAPHDDDPQSALLAGVSELRRVLTPGGSLLITVPYGAQENHGWFRQFDRAAIEELIDAIAPREVELTVFAYSSHGWRRSTLEAAADARYHDSAINKHRAPDLAAAARAVACARAVC
jgi:SAM-dependent methyltransferase